MIILELSFYHKVGEVIVLFLTSSVKFMLAPFIAKGMGFQFLDTYIICLIGGITGVSFFYFSSGYFLNKAHAKMLAKRKELIANGHTVPIRKIKKIHKLIVKVQRKFGIIGLALLTPSFLSIPIGAIISAKFYRKRKSSYPILIFGVVIVGFLLTVLTTFLPNIADLSR